MKRTFPFSRQADEAAGGPGPWRAMVVEDEESACERLVQLLEDRPGIEIVAVARTVAEAATLFVETQPDLVFLDIELNGVNGFDLLPVFQPLPKIVFVTAYERFAVRAFEVNAVDFLLKPVFPSRLEVTLKRLLSLPAGAQAPEESRFLAEDIVFLPVSQASVAFPVKSIVCIEASGNFSYVSTLEKKRTMVYRNLNQWEQRLPANVFHRVERSLIVNLSRVMKISIVDRNRTRIDLEGRPEPLSIGRTALRRLKAALRSYGGISCFQDGRKSGSGAPGAG